MTGRDLDLTEVERTIVDNFHGPDDSHSTWWINPSVMARAIAPIIAAQVAEQIAQTILVAMGVYLNGARDKGGKIPDKSMQRGGAMLAAARIAREWTP